MQVRKPKSSVSLDDLKIVIRKHKEEGRRIVAEMKKIISHHQKMEEIYSDWERDMVTIDKLIEEKKEEYGVTSEEIEEDDVLQEFLSEGQPRSGDNTEDLFRSHFTQIHEGKE